MVLNEGSITTAAFRLRRTHAAADVWGWPETDAAKGGTTGQRSGNHHEGAGGRRGEEH